MSIALSCINQNWQLFQLVSHFSFCYWSSVAIKSFAWSNQLFAIVSKTGAPKGLFWQLWTGCKTEQVEKKWLMSLESSQMTLISMMNDSNTQYLCHKLKNHHSKRYLEFRHPGTFGKNGLFDISWYYLADILTLGDRLGPVCYLGNVWTSKIYVWLPPHSKKYFRHPGTNFTYLGGPAT